MSDLDIQIDVPDDDDLGPSSVRVLNEDRIPPWLKAAVILLVGLLSAVVVGAFLLGRSRGDDGALGDSTTSESSEISSSEVATTTSEPAAPVTADDAQLYIDRSLAAVDAWQQYARTGDLTGVDAAFDPEGPQYALFAQGAPPDSADAASTEFTASNLSVASDGALTVVTLDLVVADSAGEQHYPYDFVYRGGGDRVWTVVDRRSPGTVAIPPPQNVVDAASVGWGRFTGAVSSGDDQAAAAAVSSDTMALAADLATRVANDGGPSTDGPVQLSADLDAILLERARQADADNPQEVVLAILDREQQAAVVNGTLTSWTTVDESRVIATLEHDGQAVATVPFVAAAEGWVFDLAGALRASEEGES